jgi:hypothetical protein
MVPVVSLLIVVTLSMVVTRIAAVALVHTGLSHQAARFQARSAFTGVGFTTTEAEHLVNHPVRRRIVMWLMLLGNIGIITVMSSVLLSFLQLQSGAESWLAFAIMIAGLLALLALSRSPLVERGTNRIISWALTRWTSVDARDYARLLHLRDEYGVSELQIEEGDWLAGRQVKEAAAGKEGILILGIECPGGHYIGAPPADTELRAGDRLILYGWTPRVAELDQRAQGADGDARHEHAMAAHREVAAEERARAGR